MWAGPPSRQPNPFADDGFMKMLQGVSSRSARWLGRLARSRRFVRQRTCRFASSSTKILSAEDRLASRGRSAVDLRDQRGKRQPRAAAMARRSSKKGCSSEKLVRWPRIVTERLRPGSRLAVVPRLVAAMAVDEGSPPCPPRSGRAAFRPCCGRAARGSRRPACSFSARAFCLRACRRLTTSAMAAGYFLRKASSETTSAPFWPLSARRRPASWRPRPASSSARPSCADAGDLRVSACGFGAASSAAARGASGLHVELELEIDRRIVEAAHGGERDFELLRHIGEGQADLEAGVGDLEVPVLELQHDRHLLGITLAQPASRCARPARRSGR